MELIFPFREMPLQVDNRFIGFFKHWINLSDKFLNQKWLLYNNNELRFSYSKRLWQAIRRYKKVINKKSIVLRKRSSISIRFIFSRICFIFSNLLSYQENVERFSWKYKFYDITDTQDYRIFFTIYAIKALGMKMLKKQKKMSCCQRRSKCYSTMNYYYSTILFYAACRIHQQTLYLQWHRILYLHIRIKRDD